MTIAMPETTPTRAAMVQAYRGALLSLIEEATHTVDELVKAGEDAAAVAVAVTGELSAAEVVSEAIGNVPVLTRRDVDEAIAAVWSQAIPMPEETSAEVHTPASIVVWAVCPRCSLAQPIVVTIKPELLVSDEGSELRVKAKAKGRTHICGQLPLPVVADGQESLGLDEGEPAPDVYDETGDDVDVLETDREHVEA